MIRLTNATSDLITLVTAQNGAKATVNYSDATTTAYTGGNQVTSITSGTTTTICSSPASSTVRDIDQITIYNSYAGSHAITVNMSVSATAYVLVKITLLQDESLSYTHADGWKVTDASGQIKVSLSGTLPSLAVTGVTNLSAGTVAAPSLILAGETSTGLYRIGANNHGYAVSGAKVLDISATGLGVTGTATISGDTSIGTQAATSQRLIYAYGGNTNANDGAAYLVKNGAGGSTVAALGNYSAILGGAYDATALLYASGSIKLAPVGSVVGTFSSTGLAVTGSISATGATASAYGLVVNNTSATGPGGLRVVTSGSAVGTVVQFEDNQGAISGFGKGLLMYGASSAAPTDGDKGYGTINVKTDVYKNGTAYNNPDYVLEHWATGGIVKYADKDGAAEYKGVMSLAETEAFARSNLHLPGFGQSASHGIFSGSDRLLASVEEAYIHLFDISRRLAALESK